MENVFPIFGVIFGVLVGYFLAVFNNKASKGQIENELRQQISQKDVQIRTLQEKEVASASAVSTAISVQKSAEEQLLKINEKYEASLAQLEGLKNECMEQGKSLATALADLEASRSLLKDKEALYTQQQKDLKEAQEKAISDLRDTFKALSSDALKQNAPEFLRLANESFLKFQETAKGDLAQRQEAISGLIKPLEEQLKVYQSHLQQSESSQTKVLGEIGNQLSTLTKQSESLASETEQFRMVLKSNQARGRWGEETLRRVVEAAGMSVHCDFEEQTQVEDKKPDMIVRLPGDRVIIVDSKVPDLDFITALETADLEKRQVSLKAHASKLKDTIRQLADRDYPSQFPNSLDHVVLFLPAESLFSAALEGDEELITWAASKKIMLATPASLIALLRSVSISWQQFTQTQNVQAIAESAKELYSRVVKFTEHFEKIGQSLSKAKDAYNDALGNYEKRIKPSGEKLIELGLKTDGKEMADIKDIDGDLRLPSSI